MNRFKIGLLAIAIAVTTLPAAFSVSAEEAVQLSEDAEKALQEALDTLPSATTDADILNEDVGPQEAGGSDFLRNVRGGATTTGGVAGMGTRRTLPQIVGGLIQAAMGLAGVVMLVLVVYGGAIWMTAQGSDEKIKKARNILSSASIGLLIVLAGWSITSIVIRLITTGTGS